MEDTQLIKVDNFPFDKVYFGSPIKFDGTIKSPSEVLFITPYKGIASIFACDKSLYKINGSENVAHINIDYDEWKLDAGSLEDPLSTVHVVIEGDPDRETSTFQATGYIYEIDATKYKDQIFRYPWQDETKEFLIVGSPEIEYTEVIEHQSMRIVRGGVAKDTVTEEYIEGLLDYFDESNKPAKSRNPNAEIRKIYNEVSQFKYGFLVNGKPMTDQTKMTLIYMIKHYKTLSIEDIKKYKLGICFDHAKYIAELLKQSGIEFKTYCTMIANKRNVVQAHVFTAAVISSKTYIIETSSGENDGIHAETPIKYVDKFLIPAFKDLCKFFGVDINDEYAKPVSDIIDITHCIPEANVRYTKYFDNAYKSGAMIRDQGARKVSKVPFVASKIKSIFTKEYYSLIQDEDLCIQEEAITTKERNKLDDSEFGIPELRKYPLTDKQHVLQAVRYFNKAPDKYKEELAKRIIKRAKELDMDYSNWDSLSSYIKESFSQLEYSEFNQSDDFYQESNTASSKRPMYFYHLFPKNIVMDDKGLKTPEYVLIDEKNEKLYLKMVDKYRNRLCGDWGIYPDKDPAKLTALDIYRGLNIYRKSSRGNNRIYFFRYAPTPDMGPNMRNILKDKVIVRIDINDKETKKYINDINWGKWPTKDGKTRELNKSLYNKVSREMYFARYDDNAVPLFGSINHISIDPSEGYLPTSLLTIDKYTMNQESYDATSLFDMDIDKSEFFFEASFAENKQKKQIEKNLKRLKYDPKTKSIEAFDPEGKKQRITFVISSDDDLSQLTPRQRKEVERIRSKFGSYKRMVDRYISINNNGKNESFIYISDKTLSADKNDALQAVYHELGHHFDFSHGGDMSKYPELDYIKNNFAPEFIKKHRNMLIPGHDDKPYELFADFMSAKQMGFRKAIKGLTTYKNAIDHYYDAFEFMVQSFSDKKHYKELETYIRNNCSKLNDAAEAISKGDMLDDYSNDKKHLKKMADSAIVDINEIMKASRSTTGSSDKENVNVKKVKKLIEKYSRFFNETLQDTVRNFKRSIDCRILFLNESRNAYKNFVKHHGSSNSFKEYLVELLDDEGYIFTEQCIDECIEEFMCENNINYNDEEGFDII